MSPDIEFELSEAACMLINVRLLLVFGHDSFPLAILRDGVDNIVVIPSDLSNGLPNFAILSSHLKADHLPTV